MITQHESMQQLINFCIKSSEEDFFKYLMLSAALERDAQEIQNLLDKYST